LLVFPEFCKPYIIDSLTNPIVIKHFWVLNTNLRVDPDEPPQQDFMLQKISYLEETTGPTYRIGINGSEFWVPAEWNILVVDPETSAIDFVGFQSCASLEFNAFLFSPIETSIRYMPVRILDYVKEKSLVHPAIDKGNAMACPVGPIKTRVHQELHVAIIIGPYELYKHLQNKTIGDLLP